ncbi:choice-of-anchor P family protein [Actinomadura opuntiae]|uniref:choice-of-anchor P family protein n=1 Tax=Actinomadura sp. OS1-43 TaxID=604315 RepID=UPI00255AA5A5|nr:choice-of-anchor P family protein [Actinomadura sp. OS1-43]MDL4813480.1 choice-of-anchor P family protein [Actinomadura sp. OS1-43]
MHAFRRMTTAGLLAAGLTAAAVPAAGAALAAPSDPVGSAYGLAVTGPLGAVPPVPAVSSERGAAHKSLLREDRTKLVRASALDVDATPANARSNVSHLAVPTAKLAADAVTATCRDGRGGAHLTQAVVAGKRLDATPPPNTTIPVDVEGVGRTSLVLNKQQPMPDGRLAVTAMQLNLPGGKGAVRVASATCGRAAAQRPAEAPAPKPVKHHDLAVTG